jgi:hypothetical protein
MYFGNDFLQGRIGCSQLIASNSLALLIHCCTGTEPVLCHVTQHPGNQKLYCKFLQPVLHIFIAQRALAPV